ncbi:MAG TPA: hypothetical protein VL978_02910 [Puia sp.]|nr:hypothetical protein [Puia sp.]
MLVKSDEAYLIDHELGFEITDQSFTEMVNWQWPERYYRWHIFFDYLRRSPHALKKHYFDEFADELRLMNTPALNIYFEQLRNYGYPDRNREVIVAYFSDMRQNWAKFVNMLKGFIG